MRFLIMILGCWGWVSLTGSLGHPMFGSLSGFILNAVPSALWGCVIRDFSERFSEIRSRS